MSDLVTNRPVVQPAEPQQPNLPATTASPELDPNEEADGGVMTLREHLFELRDRLVKAALGVGVGTAVGFFVAQYVLSYFANLICAGGAGDECRLVIIDPTEGIVTYFKVGLYIGVALSLPITIYQLVRFMAPGLTRQERRILFSTLPFVSVLFVIGSAFALVLVLPAMLGFLSGFMPQIFRPDLRAATTLSLALSVTLWLGIVFEMPLVMFLLTKLNVVTWQKLLGWWRWAVVLIMIMSAIITPTPDPINMLIVAVPMVILYALGIGLARLGSGRTRAATA